VLAQVDFNTTTQNAILSADFRFFVLLERVDIMESRNKKRSITDHFKPSTRSSC
jgi:hypothetical protein